MNPLPEQRIALNDARFREANERIGAAADAYDVDMAIPFICECADAGCTKVVLLEREEYESIRANARHFFNIPGHEAAAEGAAVVVQKRDGYVVVEMTGDAGDVAEALDARSAGAAPGQTTAGQE